VQSLFLTIAFQFDGVLRLRCIPCWVIACRYHAIGASKLTFYDSPTKGLAHEFWLPSFISVPHKGQSCLLCNTMWYDINTVACHIWVISVPWVHFLWLAPPVSGIRNAKYSANLGGVGVVIIMIRINLVPVLPLFMWGISIEPCGSQEACCSITSSGCPFS